MTDRDIIKEIEWGSYHLTQEGRQASACPSCHGIKPDHPQAQNFIKTALGHQWGCPIAKTLGSPSWAMPKP